MIQKSVNNSMVTMLFFIVYFIVIYWVFLRKLDKRK